MKPTNDNFWLFISIALFVMIVGTAWVYAFRPFSANAVTQSQDSATASSQAQTAPPSYGQSSGCGVQ